MYCTLLWLCYTICTCCFLLMLLHSFLRMVSRVCEDCKICSYAPSVSLMTLSYSSRTATYISHNRHQKASSPGM